MDFGVEMEENNIVELFFDEGFAEGDSEQMEEDIEGIISSCRDLKIESVPAAKYPSVRPHQQIRKSRSEKRISSSLQSVRSSQVCRMFLKCKCKDNCPHVHPKCLFSAECRRFKCPYKPGVASSLSVKRKQFKQREATCPIPAQVLRAFSLHELKDITKDSSVKFGQN